MSIILDTKSRCKIRDKKIQLKMYLIRDELKKGKVA